MIRLAYLFISIKISYIVRYNLQVAYIRTRARQKFQTQTQCETAKKVISNRGSIDCAQRAFRLATFESDFPLTMRVPFFVLHLALRCRSFCPLDIVQFFRRSVYSHLLAKDEEGVINKKICIFTITYDYYTTSKEHHD